MTILRLSKTENSNALHNYDNGRRSVASLWKQLMLFCTYFIQHCDSTFAYLLGLRLSPRWLWRMQSFGLKRHIVQREPDVSEEHRRHQCFLLSLPLDPENYVMYSSKTSGGHRTLLLLDFLRGQHFYTEDLEHTPMFLRTVGTSESQVSTSFMLSSVFDPGDGAVYSLEMSGCLRTKLLLMIFCVEYFRPLGWTWFVSPKRRALSEPTFFCWFHAWLLFDSEDGDDMFRRNVGISTRLLLVSFLAYSSTLKMEAICTSNRRYLWYPSFGCFSCWLTSRPWRWTRFAPAKLRAVSDLHDVTTQKDLTNLVYALRKS
jgi:hypothetical protein